ncbi:type II and III secretion system protein family protein [Robiginitomaculum antarcticum]|uniref:type II and III secretion system protein family protein n=1 Tax=Robiginitomaculum antarcticum TaxID=437507 RepID=UPI000369E1E2|nr:type II and III secretion system protein family protein [Robiginitomaculum antarcticum]
MNIKHILTACLAFASLIYGPHATAKAWIENAPAGNQTEAAVTKGSPVVMRTDKAFSDIMVADSKIADVVVLTDKSFHLIGKTSGKTNIMLYDDQKSLIGIVDVDVGYDIAALKKGLYETFPNERIEVRSMANSIYISGKVSSSNIADRAIKIAQSFAPDDVTNGLVIKDSHQVMLQVRFVEASRETAKDLGVGLLIQNQDGILSGRGGLLGGGVPIGKALVTGLIGTTNLDLTIDALEEKGIVRTLAEPNLVAMSGETASFLAGGEFPIPIESQNGGITIQFRQFGVGLAFTPTVLDDGIINLIVAPEVSQLDTSRAVRIGGVEIPALNVRRAKTTIELRNGQSFAIAGLLQNSRSDSKIQVPWIGDVPILGSLFRSTRYKKNETELVIIITPKLVRPAADISDLATPLDRVKAPSEAEQFIFGRVEAPQDGGLAGTYGHVIQ